MTAQDFDDDYFCGVLLKRTKCPRISVHNESFNLGTLSFHLLSIPVVKFQFFIVKATVLKLLLQCQYLYEYFYEIMF